MHTCSINTFLKRGYALHHPNFMYINPRHIVMVKPLGLVHRVTRHIKQSEDSAKIGGRAWCQREFHQ